MKKKNTIEAGSTKENILNLFHNVESVEGKTGKVGKRKSLKVKTRMTGQQ